MSKFNLFISRLDETPLMISESASFSDLGILEEGDLKLLNPIHLNGKAFLMEGLLHLELTIKFNVLLPCSICNELNKIDVSIKDFNYTEEIKKVSNPFNYKEFLREEILLELPHFSECYGKCPERVKLKNYLKNNEPAKGKDVVYFPFSEL